MRFTATSTDGTIVLSDATPFAPSTFEDRSTTNVSGESVLPRMTQNSVKAENTESPKKVRSCIESDTSKIGVVNRTCSTAEDHRSYQKLSDINNDSNGNQHFLSSLVSSRPPPLHDPMRVVTPFQLQALELLDTTPIWIFDFIQLENRWANAAGLKLWDAPNLEEYLKRDNSDLSETALIRCQNVQDRISQGQKVQEQWTFYPNGKARTVAVTMSGLRLSPDEDHCSIFLVGTVINLNPTTRKKTMVSNSKISETTSTAGSCCGSSSEEQVVPMTKNRERGEEDKDVEKMRPPLDNHTSHDFRQSHPRQNFSESLLEEESKCCECDNIAEKEDLDADDVFLRSTNLENFRVAEIIRYLPTAVCQFDIDGNTMYLNPAAYLPEDDDFANSGNIDRLVKHQVGESKEEEFLNEEIGLDTYRDYDIDQPVDRVPHSSNMQRGLFRRFVDPNVATDIVARLKEGTSASINMEAELHTNKKGKTQWSAIQLRKTLDPVSGKPVILFSSFDRSDAIEAKKERKARVEESEFLAIMAHEIRTPLHQVTGFIDLLESTSEPHGSMDGIVHDKTEQGIVISDATSPPKSHLNNEQRGYIKLLRSSATQLMTVINDVLDYSKLEAGQMKIENIPFEPMSVVKGSIAAMQGSCQEKGLFLTMEYGKNQFEIGTLIVFDRFY
jgi:hypothetical protein